MSSAVMFRVIVESEPAQRFYDKYLTQKELPADRALLLLQESAQVCMPVGRKALRFRVVKVELGIGIAPEVEVFAVPADQHLTPEQMDALFREAGWRA